MIHQNQLPCITYLSNNNNNNVKEITLIKYFESKYFKNLVYKAQANYQIKNNFSLKPCLRVKRLAPPSSLGAVFGRRKSPAEVPGVVKAI